MKKSVQRIRLTEVFPEPLDHYTDAVVAGGFLWMSGVMGIPPGLGKEAAKDDFTEQAEEIYRQIKGGLESVGSTFDDVIRTTTYVTDINVIGLINSILKKHFGESLPASTLVEVSGLAKPELLIEVDVIAIIKEDSSE